MFDLLEKVYLFFVFLFVFFFYFVFFFWFGLFIFGCFFAINFGIGHSMIPLTENLYFLSHHHDQNSNEDKQLLVVFDGYSNNIYISKECYNDMSYVPLKSIKEKKEKKKNNEKKNEKK